MECPGHVPSGSGPVRVGFFRLGLVLGWGRAAHPLCSGAMRGSSQPVSRDLVRIIRESSKLDVNVSSLTEHIRAVDSRQAQAVEFYLRACALRLQQST